MRKRYIRNSILDKAGPVDNSGQLRRPSRSPRSQRSRSADVDCLKKYTERRVEERRNTEITDPSKLDTSKWMPLRNTPRRLPRQPGAKRLSRDARQESVDESTTGGEKSVTKSASAILTEKRHQAAVRSLSTDVDVRRNTEKSIIEQRRHTECVDPRTIATRLPQITGVKFHRETSPLARIDCETAKSAATRWMTFAKSPSPAPIPKVNPERRGSREYEPSKKSEGSSKDADASKWQPTRKFSPAKSEKGQLQRQDELDLDKDRSPSFVDINEGANKLNQRMRDLYDFKTENEWPKRAGSSERENPWISKSSSEEERCNYQPVRRNSQDLEFNDRIDIFKSKVQQEDDKRRTKRDDRGLSEDELDERLRRFNYRLRYSEDLGTVQIRGRKGRDERERRELRLFRPSEAPIKRDRPEVPAIKRLVDKENKRNSDASARSRDDSPRVSYVEVDFTKRNSRTSDASYASVNVGKRGSVECKSTRKILVAPPRRAFSQSDERPATPVPPIEFNDEHYVPKRLPSEPQQRDSTRYKVYLT